MLLHPCLLNLFFCVFDYLLSATGLQRPHMPDSLYNRGNLTFFAYGGCFFLFCYHEFYGIFNEASFAFYRGGKADEVVFSITDE